MRVHLEQTPELLLLFPIESTQSVSAAVNGNIAVDLYPVSAEEFT